MNLEASIHALELSKNKFKAIGVLDGYVETTILESLTKYSPNQSVLYRHVHPSGLGEGEIFGNISTANLEDIDVNGIKKKGIVLEGELMEYTENQKALKELLELKESKGENLKISIGFQEFTSNGKAVDARPFEYSITPYPVCKECEVKTMVNEDARIKELEDLLNEAKNRENDLKAKVNKFESENAKLKDVNTKSLEDKINEIVSKVTKEYEDKYIKVTSELEETKKKLDLAEKEPILAEIAKFEDDADVMSYLSTLPKAKLMEKLEKKRKSTSPSIVTQTMEQSRNIGKDEIAEAKRKLYEAIRKDTDLNEAIYGKVPDTKRFGL